ncbi:Uu.00g049470.m01.CDS01 [Anthostomella pinea]|uniref:Uu.00g049470.m01.CDS01 n=1 Tax=Anthostomella pinea TaxID=933095 RepID=A0AAI8YCD9_9PEZI|nr:Uu.00g049470.m01.CDS01 [Anthostomella pinea]
MSSIPRGTSLRAGGACVRCRKGKTKCVYDNGRAPCKNCAKGMHECYLPSESLAHHHGQSPARAPRPRDSLPGERSVSAASDRQPASSAAVLPRNLQTNNSEKISPEMQSECERVINKTLPSCVAFHKPSFLQKLKSGSLESSIVNGLLTCGARSSTMLIRRYGGQGGPSAAAEHFAVKTINLVMQTLDNPSLADIQALCLLTIHEWGNRNAVRAYIYLGQASRMAQMYRIIAVHQNRGDPDQFIQDESFRRTLWLIYILDCFLTSSPGRHPAVSHHDVKDVPLPCPDMSYNFGTPVFVRTLAGNPPPGVDASTPMTEVGEFGHIVMATQAWRNVIEMLTTVTPATFSEENCVSLEAGIEAVRSSLPMHFVDKPGHVNLHITMGSGYTYAMLHCLLHSATIMVNRRRLLHLVTTEGFDHKTWRMVPHAHLQTVDRVFASSHSVVTLLLALESNADKDAVFNIPLVMLFSCFTACSTVAWFSLKGLTPGDVNETAEAIVSDGMRFLQEGANTWMLAIPWYRHLSVMAKVLRNGDREATRLPVEPAPSSTKDETGSQPDNNPDSMDYERHSSANPQEPVENRGSEPPRKSGFTTINGGPAGAATPAMASPPPAETKALSPVPSSSGDGHTAEPAAASSGSDMTSAELCLAFERQLLELDDLAAFMGGGV